MATLVSQTAPVGGLEPTLAAAAAGGDKAPIGNRRFLLVRNGHTATQDVTIDTPGTTKGIAVANPVHTVDANGGLLVVPLDDIYRGADGLASVTYVGVTALTVAVIDLG
ncbi:MAG: hypothetical protein ACRDS1_01430 [Pseudonocardiaceae bacterium]